MPYQLPATKLHSRRPLRIETELDQEPGLTHAAPAARAAAAFAQISFYFNEIVTSINFGALAFHRLDWMRYLAHKKALESEA